MLHPADQPFFETLALPGFVPERPIDCKEGRVDVTTGDRTSPVL